MKLPREPFSWDGGEDEPIPLDDEGLAVLAAAESHVRSAQDALAREDTEPALIDLGHVGTQMPESVPVIGVSSRALRVSLLALACAVAFAHGWRQGAAQAAPPPCESGHCMFDVAPEGSTKE